MSVQVQVEMYECKFKYILVLGNYGKWIWGNMGTHMHMYVMAGDVLGVYVNGHRCSMLEFEVKEAHTWFMVWVVSENWVYGWEPGCRKDKIWNYELICYPKSEEDPFVLIVWSCQISHSNHTCHSTNEISLQAFHVHTLPSSTIGTLQSHTCLLMPWLHSCPMHVAAYQKPCALIHVSTCICLLQSCTHMLRPPVMCIHQSLTCVHDHVYQGQSFTHVHFVRYFILVWYRNPYQTYSCCTGLMMQTPQTKMVINHDQNHGWPAFNNPGSRFHSRIFSLIN